MLRMLNKRGQNTAEYAILIGVIVAAAIAMQVYVRRGMQARVKDGVDHSMNMDSGGVFNTSQYEPYYMDSNTQTTQDSEQRDEFQVGGDFDRFVLNETITRTGTSTAGNYTEWDNL